MLLAFGVDDVPVGIHPRGAAADDVSHRHFGGGCSLHNERGGIVLSIPDVRAQSVRVGAWIDSYDSAVVSIAAIMERDLGLPAIQASLYFYADRNAFQQALELDELQAGVGPRRCDAVGHRRLQRVVLNDANLHWLEWPNRVALLAHELTHTVQYGSRAADAARPSSGCVKGLPSGSRST